MNTPSPSGDGVFTVDMLLSVMQSFEAAVIRDHKEAVFTQR